MGSCYLVSESYSVVCLLMQKKKLNAEKRHKCVHKNLGCKSHRSPSAFYMAPQCVHRNTLRGSTEANSICTLLLQISQSVAEATVNKPETICQRHRMASPFHSTFMRRCLLFISPNRCWEIMIAYIDDSTRDLAFYPTVQLSSRQACERNLRHTHYQPNECVFT